MDDKATGHLPLALLSTR